MNKQLSNITSDQIISGCKRQDPRCQKTLYQQTVKGLYNVVYRIVLNHQETQDILQESFVKIFQKIDQFDSKKGSVYSWMCRISINTALNGIRKKRLIFTELNEFNAGPDHQISALQEMEAEDILQLISRLPDTQRIIFNLHEIEGYKHQEIADMIGINVNSCRVLLSRAKNRLQKMIIEPQLNHKSNAV